MRLTRLTYIHSPVISACAFPSQPHIGHLMHDSSTLTKCSSAQIPVRTGLGPCVYRHGSIASPSVRSSSRTRVLRTENLGAGVHLLSAAGQWNAGMQIASKHPSNAGWQKSTSEATSAQGVTTKRGSKYDAIVTKRIDCLSDETPPKRRHSDLQPILRPEWPG